MFTNADGEYWLDNHIVGRPYHALIDKHDLRGRWHNIVVKARWSRGADEYFHVWVNGILKVRYGGASMTVSRVYFKYGLYRSFVSRSPLSKSVSQSVYFDEVRRGLSRRALDIRMSLTPNP